MKIQIIPYLIVFAHEGLIETLFFFFFFFSFLFVVVVVEEGLGAVVAVEGRGKEAYPCFYQSRRGVESSRPVSSLYFSTKPVKQNYLFKTRAY